MREMQIVMILVFIRKCSYNYILCYVFIHQFHIQEAFLLSITGGWNSEASKHIIGIMPSLDVDAIELVVSTQQSNPVNFEVSSSLGSITNSSTSVNSPTTISIDKSYAVESINNRSNGILLTTSSSTNRISVLVTILSSSFSSGTYRNFPPWGYSVNEYIYYAVSADTTNDNAFSSIVLVAANANTSIAITPTQDIVIPADLATNGAQVTLVAGDTATLTLDYLESLLIKSDNDLTGSKVVSNKPIAFYSGHTGANLPTEKFAWDFIGEQYPPTVAWGDSFLVGSFVTRERFILNAIASQSSTIINISCSNGLDIMTNIPDTGSDISETIVPESIGSYYCSVSADKPVLLTQFGLGQGDDFENGDPYSIYLPPTHQYYSLKSYIFSVVELADHTGYFNLAVRSDSFDSSAILVDGVPLDSWNDVPSADGTIVGHIARVTTSNSMYNVTFTNSKDQFSIVAYALTSLRGHGHIEGINLLPYGYQRKHALQYIEYKIYSYNTVYNLAPSPVSPTSTTLLDSTSDTIEFTLSSQGKYNSFGVFEFFVHTSSSSDNIFSVAPA